MEKFRRISKDGQRQSESDEGSDSEWEIVAQRDRVRDTKGQKNGDRS